MSLHIIYSQCVPRPAIHNIDDLVQVIADYKDDYNCPFSESHWRWLLYWPHTVTFTAACWRNFLYPDFLHHLQLVFRKITCTFSCEEFSCNSRLSLTTTLEEKNKNQKNSKTTNNNKTSAKMCVGSTHFQWQSTFWHNLQGQTATSARTKKQN